MSRKKRINFIENIIENDIKNGTYKKIHTRFPPEPNGYLHIGHAKSICLNFSLAEKYGGLCNLRYDDTNPEKEDEIYVKSIQEDIQWLGYKWHDKAYFTSDYFSKLYEWAILLIKKGRAYVDDQSGEEISRQRTEPTKPGIESPFRNRKIEENLRLFTQMKAGRFKAGERVLRAKIDMNSPNMLFRDPILYRIIHKPHHNTGSDWCIYPTYDFAHGQSDLIEGISHSICTLEFEVHKPLYNWLLDQLVSDDYRPKQIEFSRLNLTYTVMSKRKLLTLVNEKYVSGWDDPRMPTLSAMRRRGYPPKAIRIFAEKVGVTKRKQLTDIAFLEYCVRNELNKTAPRVMVVLNPVKLIIENYPVAKTEYLEAQNNPEDAASGVREIPFSKELFIEREDFMENPTPKFFRLSIGKEVRLKNAYIIKASRVEKGENNGIKTIYCSYNPKSKSGSGSEASKAKVKATLHWVSAKHALAISVRKYDYLFTTASPDAEVDFRKYINPNSLKILNNCYAEPILKTAKPTNVFQFQRIGYFCVDKDTTDKKLIFNQTVPLRDNWKKIISQKHKNQSS